MDSPAVPSGVESTIQPITLTQMRLAHIQEFETSVLKGKRDEPLLRKERAQVRRLLLQGAVVEDGPLTAALIGPKKRLVVS